jgi:hypothetical protein
MADPMSLIPPEVQQQLEALGHMVMGTVNAPMPGAPDPSATPPMPPQGMPPAAPPMAPAPVASTPQMDPMQLLSALMQGQQQPEVGTGGRILQGLANSPLGQAPGPATILSLIMGLTGTPAVIPPGHKGATDPLKEMLLRAQLAHSIGAVQQQSTRAKDQAENARVIDEAMGLQAGGQGKTMQPSISFGPRGRTLTLRTPTERTDPVSVRAAYMKNPEDPAAIIAMQALTATEAADLRKAAATGQQAAQTKADAFEQRSVLYDKNTHWIDPTTTHLVGDKSHAQARAMGGIPLSDNEFGILRRMQSIRQTLGKMAAQPELLTQLPGTSGAAFPDWLNTHINNLKLNGKGTKEAQALKDLQTLLTLDVAGMKTPGRIPMLELNELKNKMTNFTGQTREAAAQSLKDIADSVQGSIDAMLNPGGGPLTPNQKSAVEQLNK